MVAVSHDLILPLRGVGGYGPTSARLIAVGEAPGLHEMRSLRPFTGRSGDLFWRTIHDLGYGRAQVYVTNTLRYPADDVPSATRLKNAMARREELLEELRGLPNRHVILALGATAASVLLGGKVTIGNELGQARYSEELNCWVVPTWHPAYVLRVPNFQHDLLWSFKRAVRMLDVPVGQLPPPMVPTVNVPATRDEALLALNDIRNRAQVIACDLETTGLNPRTGEILDIGFAWSDTEAMILSGDVLHDCNVVDMLRLTLQDETITWLWHNGKFDVQWLRNAPWRIPARIDADTMLLHHALDERGGDEGGQHGLKSLAARYCDAHAWDAALTEHKRQHVLAQKGKRRDQKVPWSMAMVEPAVRHPYLAYDVCYTYRLHRELFALHRDEPTSRYTFPEPLECYRNLVLPAASVAAEMEYRGIRVNVQRLDEIVAHHTARMGELASTAEELLGETIKFTSPKQVSAVLYERLRYPVQYGKTGNPSTDKLALHALKRADLLAGRESHPFLDMAEEYRSLAHDISTYLEGIRGKLDQDSRLHTTFSLHGTATGRWSSHEPNVQNIPSNSMIKDMFVPTPGYVLLNADYRRLEVGVLAWYCRDPQLISDFLSPDMHWTVARDVFHDITDSMLAARGDIAALDAVARKYPVFNEFAARQRGAARTNDPEELWKWLVTRIRRQAKYVTFGRMYGRRAKALTDPETGIGGTEEQAELFIQRWNGRYPLAVKWIDEQTRQARTAHWVEGGSGRRRRFILWSEDQVNQAINHPVQSLASDIQARATTLMHGKFAPSGKAYPLIPVHDSILMEVREDVVDEIVADARNTMRGVLLDDDLTFDVDIAVGYTWATLKDVEKAA